MDFILNLFIGASTGLLSGFGIGGGSLLMLYLTLFLDMSQIIAQGVNLIYFISCAPPAIIYHYKNKMIDTKLTIYIASAGVLSSILSAFMAQKLQPELLKRLFGLLLLCIGIKTIINNIKNTD